MLLPAQQPPSSLGPSIWSLPSSSLQISQISMRSNKSSISPVSVRRGRPPPRPLRLPQHRCPALLPQPQGFSDGPENGLSSTRPSSQPGCRVSASGDRFCGTSNLTAHEQRVTAGPLLSLLFFRPATLIVSVPA